MRSVFNSLGSNYSLAFALRSLIQTGGSSKSTSLTKYLESRYHGQAHLFYKGREAIQAALMLAKLGKGSKVLITGYTCYAVYRAVVDAGCEPVFVDLAPGSINFDSDTILTSLKKHKNVRALIMQNTLGFASDIESIKKISDDNKLVLIEDLAHCIGMKYSDGSEAGTVGDYVALSFSQDKVVDGISGGALIVRTKNGNDFDKTITYTKLPATQQLRDRIYPALTVKIRFLYNLKIGKLIHVFAKKLHLLSRPVDGVFGEYRQLPGWYAALIHRQFLLLDKSQAHRSQICEIYSNTITKTVQAGDKVKNSPHLRFPILIPKNRNDFIVSLKKKNIHISDIWYESPIAPLRYLGQTNYQQNECPVSEKMAEQMINLPTHTGISIKTAKIIAQEVNLWLSQAEK